jgi:hypothetical protein
VNYSCAVPKVLVGKRSRGASNVCPKSGWHLVFTVLLGLGVVAGSTPAGELGRVPLRVAQSIKMLSKKKTVLLGLKCQWVLYHHMILLVEHPARPSRGTAVDGRAVVGSRRCGESHHLRSLSPAASHLRVATDARARAPGGPAAPGVGPGAARRRGGGDCPEMWSPNQEPGSA